MEIFNTFDKANHLQPDFDKAKFDTLHGWDFGWEILQLIDVARGDEDEIKLSSRFSPGQKALYFFWHVDAQVTNGGFIQFYWNGYGKYIPPILNGLKLIGDSAMYNLVVAADEEYQRNKMHFDSKRTMSGMQSLYEDLKKFDEYDSAYYEIHETTMGLLEKYARQNPDDFVKLK